LERTAELEPARLTAATEKRYERLLVRPLTVALVPGPSRVEVRTMPEPSRTVRV
jgi:hypothetical protein